MIQPEIRIQYGFLLEPLYQRVFAANPDNVGKDYPTREHMLEKLEDYKSAWAPLEAKILNGMCKVLGLEFYQSTIEAHFVYSKGSMSSPMIIGYCKGEPDRFVDTLTHELLHRLLTDNTRKVDVRSIWQQMFPDLELLARNHVLVHAVHAYIYLEVLNEPHRLEQNIAKDQKYPGYKVAWDIVQQRGYKSVIDAFKAHY